MAHLIFGSGGVHMNKLELSQVFENWITVLKLVIKNSLNIRCTAEMWQMASAGHGVVYPTKAQCSVGRQKLGQM